LCALVALFLFSRYRHPRDLHSFPTRRSSNLEERMDTCGCSAVFFDAAAKHIDHFVCSRFVHHLATARNKGFDDVSILILDPRDQDRKSTRLNSSHVKISYAVFCLKKKKNR